MSIREWPYGGHVTRRAGRADFPIIGGALSSPGLLLYCYVYEARWAGLKTTELCPRWIELSDSDREAWEERALEIGTHPFEAARKDFAKMHPTESLFFEHWLQEWKSKNETAQKTRS